MAGAYARHVLHLIADWRAAVAELCRVVGRRGDLIDVGGGADGWLRVWQAMQPALGPEADPIGLDVVGQGTDVLDEAFATSGGRLRAVEEIPSQRQETVADALATSGRNALVDLARRGRRTSIGDPWSRSRVGDDEFGTLDVRLVEERPSGGGSTTSADPDRAPLNRPTRPTVDPPVLTTRSP